MKTELPKCPKCKSSDKVKIVRCKCMSCPPWICMNCPPYENAGHLGYEFYDYDEYECDECRDKGYYFIDNEKIPCICSESQEDESTEEEDEEEL